ncbi:MAG: thioesterase family protein [Actinobacteria bacterium]|nr:thioesterase family protein [Actinomycetota bacterium]
MSAVSATASVTGRTAATATVVLSPPRPALQPTVLPAPPADVTALEAASPFVIPPEFVPISTRMQMRTAIGTLPYSGAAHPRLCAWIRLRDAVHDPYERLLVLADAFAPSYAAVLHRPHPVPTIRMTARFTPGAATADDDWVLLEARTDDVGEDAWMTERVTLWSRDGLPLVTSTQLRTVLT